MSDVRTFPVHPTDRWMLKSVPWSLLEAHRATIERNHGGQSLEKLRSRGGLSLQEIYCGLKEMRLLDCQGNQPHCLPYILDQIAAHSPKGADTRPEGAPQHTENEDE